MLKYISLALLLALVNGQVILPSNPGTIQIGGTQYILVPVGQVGSATTLSLPYLTRQPYSIGTPLARSTTYIRPATTVIQAPAPTIAVAQPRPVVVAAPQPVVVQAPRPVVVAAPRPQIIAEESYGPPQPYTFGFQSTDEQGNTLQRSESADGSGTVTGSYSYLDAQGLQRIVEYVADAAGYRANVKTNEPGTANANPADVQIQASEPPANVQQTVAAYSQPRAQVVKAKVQ